MINTTKKYYAPENILGDSIELYNKQSLLYKNFEIIDSDSSEHPKYDLLDNNTGIKFECKSCKNAGYTDNLFFEVWDNYPKKKGNILESEASVWIYNVLDWDEEAKQYIPVFILYIDFFALKEYITTECRIGRLKARFKHKGNANQGYVLIKFENIIPFLINPDRLLDFCVVKAYIGDDIPSEYYMDYQ